MVYILGGQSADLCLPSLLRNLPKEPDAHVRDTDVVSNERKGLRERNRKNWKRRNTRKSAGWRRGDQRSALKQVGMRKGGGGRQKV